jgi:hypothetical protein
MFINGDLLYRFEMDNKHITHNKCKQKGRGSAGTAQKKGPTDSERSEEKMSGLPPTSFQRIYTSRSESGDALD